jgi:hypothetical protein
MPIIKTRNQLSVKSSERYAKLSNQRVKQVYQQTMRKVIAKTRV